MAKLNPDVPDVVGTFRESRSISQPSFESAAGLELRSAAQVVSEAGTLNQTAAELYAENTVRPQAEALRDAEMKRLEGVKASGGSVDASDNIVGAVPSQQPPTDVKQGIVTAQKLQQAREDGKSGRADYLGKMQALQVSLRAQHPGWIPYIDQEISKVTGGDPANLRMAQLTRDANQGASEARARRRSVEGRLMAGEAGADGPKLYEDLQAGRRTIESVEHSIIEKTGIDKEYQRAAARNQYNKDTIENASTAAESTATQHASQQFNLSFKNDMATLGHDVFGAKTPEESAEMGRRIAAGEVNLSSEDATRIGSFFEDRLNRASIAEREFLSTPRKDGGSTWTDIKDPAKREALLKEAEAPYRTQIEYIKQGKFSVANRIQQTLDAQNADYHNRLFNGPNKDVNATMRLVAAMEKYPEFVKSATGEALFRNLPGDLAKLREQDLDRMTAQQDLNADRRPTLATLRQMWNEHKQIDPNKVPMSEETKAALMNGDLDGAVSRLTNPKTPEEFKVNLVHALFDPSNKGVLSDLNPGSKVSAYQRLTSEGVVAEVKRLSANDPRIWGEFKDWANTEFGQNIYNTEIHDMAQIQMHPDTKVTFNPETHQFNIDIGPYKNVNLKDMRQSAGGEAADISRYYGTYNQAQLEAASRTVNRLNAGLKNLTNVAKQDGDDVNAYLIHQMLSMGYNPKTATGNTFPDAIMKALSVQKPTPNANPKQ